MRRAFSAKDIVIEGSARGQEMFPGDPSLAQLPCPPSSAVYDTREGLSNGPCPSRTARRAPRPRKRDPLGCLSNQLFSMFRQISALQCRPVAGSSGCDAEH